LRSTIADIAAREACESHGHPFQQSLVPQRPRLRAPSERPAARQVQKERVRGRGFSRVSRGCLTRAPAF
jgi:hypothetical protein